MVGKIYLASQSLGRLEILKGLGYDVIVCPTDCDESGSWDSPAQMVEDLAVRKMQAFLDSGNYKNKSLPAISADTVVVFDNSVIGKANSLEEARKQITLLNGKTHLVYSSYAVFKNNNLVHGWDSAQVVFNDNSAIIEKYLECGEWKGAAGSYRIQGMGKNLIKEIRGDINTVIGLPWNKISSLKELSKLPS